MLWERRLTYGNGGNISVRLEDGSMLITPSGACKGMLGPEQMIRVDIQSGKAEEGKRPSMETPFHLGIYRRRPDVGAVVHCHPLSCTVLAVQGRPFRSAMTPEAIMVLGELVPTVAYATPGSEGLAENVSQGLGTNKACLLESHGALAVGKDLLDAFNRMDTMEYIASVQLRCEELGGLDDLPEEEIARIAGMTK
jgi:L-fuculose-phosphate aldolase